MIASFLMPAHPLAEIINETTVPEGHFSAELMKELRPLIGDDTFAHLLKYQSRDKFDWDPAKRLQVYDLAAQRDRSGLASILDEAELETYQNSRRGAWMLEQEETAE